MADFVPHFALPCRRRRFSTGEKAEAVSRPDVKVARERAIAGTSLPVKFAKTKEPFLFAPSRTGVSREIPFPETLVHSA